MMWFKRNPQRDYLKAIENVLLKKSYLVGRGLPEVRGFEKELARYLGTDDAAALNSGTDAAIHVLKIFGIGLGDEAIVPAFSFISTASSVSWVGAMPRFIDIREDDFTIDVAQIASAISEKTKAVVPVHIFGLPADIENISVLAQKHNIKVIEDAAQAIGANIGGHFAGTLADAGYFSFSSTKPLAAFGNGGALVFKDPALTQQVRLISSYGARRHYYDYPFAGVNSQMQEIQAAILRQKLPRLNNILRVRKSYAEIYDFCLAGIGDLILPQQKDGRIYYRYVVRSKFRDALKDYLYKNLQPSVSGFLSVNYPTPLPFLEAFSGLGYKRGQFPVSEKLAQEVLSLPISEELGEDDIYSVCKLIKNFFKSLAIQGLPAV